MAGKTDQIAALFASVGFIVDKKSITALESSLKRVEARLASISKGFGKMKGSNSITAGLRNTSRDAGKATTAVEGLTNAFVRGAPAMSRYTQQLNAAASAMRGLAGASPRRLPSAPGVSGGQGGGGARQGKATGFMAGLFGGGASSFARGIMPGLGAGWAVMQGTTRAREMLANESALGALTGSQAAGRDEYKYIQKFSDKYGLRASESIGGYKRILASAQGTKLQGAGAKSIFEGVSLYGKTLGLSDENMSRASTAISQMISKGKISSEELKGQLAEATPGVIQMFARANNTDVPTLFKMMENGQILAEDILPKVADELRKAAMAGGALEKQMKSSASAQARFVNAFDRMLKSLFEKGLDEGLYKFFSILTDLLPKLEPLVVILGKAFRFMLVPFEGILMIFKLIPSQINYAIAGFGALYLTLNKFGIKKTGLFLGLSLLFVLLEDIYGWTQGKKSLMGEFFGQWERVNEEVFTPIFDGFTKMVENIREAARLLGLIRGDKKPLPGGGSFEYDPRRKPVAQAWNEDGVLGAIKQTVINARTPEIRPTADFLRRTATDDARRRAMQTGKGVAGFAGGSGGISIGGDLNVFANSPEELYEQLRAKGYTGGQPQ